jgi:hypothetical protein
MPQDILEIIDFQDEHLLKKAEECSTDYHVLEIDYIYFSDDQPAVFFKEVKQFNDESAIQIAKIQRLCWNFQKVQFLYVYSKSEIRIYNCFAKPIRLIEKQFNKIDDFELFSVTNRDNDKLLELEKLFSRLAIDTGFVWNYQDASELRKKLQLDKRVDKYLISSLNNVAKELENRGLINKELVHKLVMRSLFLMYLEDRGATVESFYGEFKEGAKSYLDILKDPVTTFGLFKKLASDFNGSLFTVENDEENQINSTHLELIRQCFKDGYENSIQNRIDFDLRIFDFSIIRIELLSEIYENFLGDLEKKERGTFYTSPSLVELVLNERLPYKSETNYNVKILDPSCGSGIFLVESFKRLIKRYENAHNIIKLTDFNVLCNLLQDNIFGIEIDPKSIKVAAFSLYLALLDQLDPKTDWWNKNIQFPYLINDSEDSTLLNQGSNLFRNDTISDLSNITELQDFDLIVGNPPFGTKNLLPSVSDYCKQHDFAKEMVLPFLHKSTSLAPNGKIALIFNTKVLTNTGGTYQNFRAWLFGRVYVEKVYNFSILRKAKKNYGGQLFGSAVGPISIVFYENKRPENLNKTIEYFAPKTYLKNHILEGIVIDGSDIKYLPREECEKPDTKIWKIAMWGTFADFELIERLEKKSFNLKSFLIKHTIFDSVGFQLLTRKKDNPILNEEISKLPYIETEELTPYYTSPVNKTIVNSSIITQKAIKFYSEFYGVTGISHLNQNINVFRRLGNVNSYKTEKVLISKGVRKGRLNSTFIDYDCSFRDGAYGFYTNLENKDSLIFLSSIINSKFSYYFIFLTVSSLGIEREQVMKNEILTIPLDSLSVNQEIIKNSKEIISEIKNSPYSQYAEIEEKIEKAILEKVVGLSLDDQILIKETIEYSLDLFEKQEKSNAIKPVFEEKKLPDHFTLFGEKVKNVSKEYLGILPYIKRISREVCDWFTDGSLKITPTVYEIDKNTPLYVVKLTFGTEAGDIIKSKENINAVLKRLEKNIWQEEAKHLYIRKNLFYYDDNDVYIIKSNQRRFWTQTLAVEDFRKLIIDLGNG